MSRASGLVALVVELDRETRRGGRGFPSSLRFSWWPALLARGSGSTIGLRRRGGPSPPRCPLAWPVFAGLVDDRCRLVAAVEEVIVAAVPAARVLALADVEAACRQPRPHLLQALAERVEVLVDDALDLARLAAEGASPPRSRAARADRVDELPSNALQLRTDERVDRLDQFVIGVESQRARDVERRRSRLVLVERGDVDLAEDELAISLPCEARSVVSCQTPLEKIETPARSSSSGDLTP